MSQRTPMMIWMINLRIQMSKCPNFSMLWLPCPVLHEQHFWTSDVIMNTLSHAAFLFTWDGGYVTISDSGTDSWIIGQGWFMIHETGHHANVLGFDHNIAQKSHLPIIIACAVYTTMDSKEVLVIVNEAVLNANSPSTLMSEYQTQEAGNMVNSVSKHHFHWDGTPGHQAMKFVCAGPQGPRSCHWLLYPVCPLYNDTSSTGKMIFVCFLITLPLPLENGLPSHQIDFGKPPIPPLNSSDTLLAQQAMCQQLDDAIHLAFSSTIDHPREGGPFASPSPPLPHETILHVPHTKPQWHHWTL